MTVLGQTAENRNPATNEEPSPTLDALIDELEVVLPPEPVEEPREVEEPTPSSDPADLSIPSEEREPTARTGVSIPVPDLGASAWAVVIAGATDPFDSLLEGTLENLTAQGYETLITNCDVGAAEAIGMQPVVSYTVSAYANDRENAEGLADILREIDLGGTVAQVSVDCG